VLGALCLLYLDKCARYLLANDYLVIHALYLAKTANNYLKTHSACTWTKGLLVKDYAYRSTA
jgi:hypothetical protein